MFKISEFSQLSRVSLKTLRFYDQIGILKPVDMRLAHYAGKQQRGMLSPIVLWKESERDEAAFELEIGYVLKQDIPLPSDMLAIRM
ncbi:MerR family DNA-binding transcriptional regulator [Brevibacillus formosus]|nr:MerR family DNA-binding transcriptional regulator [Brevibacillus formosus]